LTGAVRPGQNRLTRGREFRRDEVLLPAGTILGVAEIGLAAAAGRDEVDTFQRPIVEHVATGDELVMVSSKPEPGQIRNSNGALLEALYGMLGAGQIWSSHVGDDLDALTEAFLRCTGPHGSHVLVVTGGVSAGRRDLVPQALERAGGSCVFHKIPLRPGKPMWFGVGRALEGGLNPALVFGLPGNPVSGLVCSLLFVKPALEIMAGRPVSPMVPQTARLAVPYQHEGERMTFYPAKVVGVDPLRVEPLPWAGSADLRTVAHAHGFAVFPAGGRLHAAGDQVGFLPLPGCD
jgi:molybdopterin molybdotransferase